MRIECKPGIDIDDKSRPVFQNRVRDYRILKTDQLFQPDRGPHASEHERGLTLSEVYEIIFSLFRGQRAFAIYVAMFTKVFQ